MFGESWWWESRLTTDVRSWRRTGRYTVSSRVSDFIVHAVVAMNTVTNNVCLWFRQQQLSRLGRSRALTLGAIACRAAGPWFSVPRGLTAAARSVPCDN